MKLRKKNEKPWLRIGIVAGLCHLTLVTLGAADIGFSNQHWWGRVINYYGEISGSTFGYGFFAPGVSSQIRAVFDVVESDSRQTTRLLKDDGNREIDLRIGDIIEQFIGEERKDPLEFQRALSASLSGAVFIEHPSAKSVTIRLEKFDPISMEEFRKGLRPSWVSLYSAKFINRKGSSK
ncbi:MAG TPA: hypothetical protein VIG33_15185 [Pseudobdellovibrionaceae bacterium]|jgi:hypothetical protein